MTVVSNWEVVPMAALLPRFFFSYIFLFFVSSWPQSLRTFSRQFIAAPASTESMVSNGAGAQSDSDYGVPVSSSSEREPLLRSTDDEHIISNESQGCSNGRDNDEPSQTKHTPQWQHQDTFKLLAVIFDFFMMGVYQTAVGALIPNLERFYDHGDGATASIFVVHMAGYLCATAAIESIHVRVGRRGVALMSPIIRLLAAAVLSTGPPFNVALAAYSLFGFGTALVDAGWCAWASSLPYASVCQGFMHGGFSTGAVFGPVVALAVLKRGFEWYGFYRLAVGHQFFPAPIMTC